MSLGDLVRLFFEHLYGLWPFRIVSVWESGVRYTLGKPKRLLKHDNGFFKTGLHWFWPVIGNIWTEDTNIDVLETDMQTFTLPEGETVCFSFAMKYRIKDLLVMGNTIHEPDSTLSNEVLSMVGAVLEDDKENGFESFDDVQDGITEAIRDAVSKQMEKWGVEVIELWPTSMAKVQTFRLLHEGMDSGD